MALDSFELNTRTVLTIALPLAALYTFNAIRKLLKVGKREAYLPPGPPTTPLLGNLGIFPKEYAHYKLTEWAQQYGGLYSLKLGLGTAIVITDVSIAKELMDKRSSSTVDRPPNHMADTITGGLNMVLARYTEDWRTLRRAGHAILTPQACMKHLPIQRAEATQLMYDLLKTPEEFYTSVRRYSSSVITSVLFGKRCPRYSTPEATDFFHVQHLWEHALEPGAHPPMDLLPILKRVPERFASWKTLCKEVRRLQRKLYFGLLEETEERVAKGEGNGCFMEEVLERQKEFEMNRELVGYLGGVLLEGGSDTTSSYLQSLILALTAFPDAQRKAHEEMDRVVGKDRTPMLEDLDSMPYIQAVIKEVHRFRPVAPLAIPHCTIQDEVYEQYLIPKGTTIFVNAWGMFHDPAVFDKPEEFYPDRFIQSEFGTKPGVDDKDRRHNLAFGSGRRICPGIHLAQNSINLNTMNMIWGFNFSEAAGSKVDIWDYAKGILTAPNPFKCKIEPRGAQHAKIIEHEFELATDAFLPFEGQLSESDRKYVAEVRRHH